MLRSPLNRLGPSVDEVKRTVSPEFSQGRRNFGKGAAITGAALGTGIGVAKLAKHADELATSAKTAKAAAKVVPESKWNAVVRSVYDADRANVSSKAVAKLSSRPEHLEWLHNPASRGPVHPTDFFYKWANPDGAQRDIVQKFNRMYDFEQTAVGRQYLREWEIYTKQDPILDTSVRQRELRELYQKALDASDKAEQGRLTMGSRRLLEQRRKMQQELDEITDEVADVATDDAYMISGEDGFDLSDSGFEELSGKLFDEKLMDHPRWNQLVKERGKIPTEAEIIKYDPNTIKYREARMQAMAEKHGDELWVTERKRLIGELENTRNDRRQIEAWTTPEMQQQKRLAAHERKLEAQLKRHLELNPDAPPFLVGAAMLPDDEEDEAMTNEQNGR